MRMASVRIKICGVTTPEDARFAAECGADAAGLEHVRRYVEAARQLGRPPAAVLIDSHVEGQMGGTGHAAPWELLRGFDPGVPLVLAGGLTPENVAEAVALVRPWGVDVASGVESAPGRKDPDKVARFVQAARAAAGG